jgi:hypothetical protein
MERLKRNPGVWGVVLGGLIVLVSTFFPWFKLTNTANGVSTKVTPLNSVSGQTILLIAILAMMCGLGILVAGGKGRIVWALLALLCGVVMLVAAILGLFSPSTLAERFATTAVISKLVLSTSISNATQAITQALNSGAVTASTALGSIVGVVGGALATLGALLSFKTPAKWAD